MKTTIKTLPLQISLAILLSTSGVQALHAGTATKCADTYKGIKATLTHVQHTPGGLYYRLTPHKLDYGAWYYGKMATITGKDPRVLIPQGGEVCILCQTAGGESYAGTKVWDWAYTSLKGKLLVGWLPDYFVYTGYKGRDPHIPAC